MTDVLVWLLIGLAVWLLVTVEILGLMGYPQFHTISYISHHNPIFRWAIFSVFCGLAAWWVWHSGQEIVQ